MSTTTGRKPLKRSAIRGILDSGYKGCENKGMHIKIPCKKYRFVVLTGLVSILLLAMPGLLLASGQPATTDRALFWSIQKEGQTAGYLLGTIHSEDPRVLDFSPELLTHLQASDFFAMERVPDIAALTRLNDYMHYPEGQNLESVIGVDRFNALTAALATYNLPGEFISTMKPWAAMMTLSTPPPVTGFFMDLSLSLRASGSGLKVIGLETLEQQLSFLENIFGSFSRVLSAAETHSVSRFPAS